MFCSREKVWGIAANLGIDFFETGYDFLSVEGWYSLFRDEC